MKTLLKKVYNHLREQEHLLINDELKFFGTEDQKLFEKLFQLIEHPPQNIKPELEEIQNQLGQKLDLADEEQTHNISLFQESLRFLEEEFYFDSLVQQQIIQYVRYIISWTIHKGITPYFDLIYKKKHGYPRPRFNGHDAILLDFMSWLNNAKINRKKVKGLFNEQKNLPNSPILDPFLDAIFKIDPLIQLHVQNIYHEKIFEFEEEVIHEVCWDQRYWDEGIEDEDYRNLPGEEGARYWLNCEKNFMDDLKSFYCCCKFIKDRLKDDSFYWNYWQELYLDDLIRLCEEHSEECLAYGYSILPFEQT